MYQPESIIRPLESLEFDNRFVTELPGDPERTNARRQVERACYSLVEPTPVAEPSLVSCSPPAADLLDLNPEICQSREFLEVFSGNRLLPGMRPFAMCYGGHQFGSWAGQLGDGRAINLGEVINRASERWVIQLKGAGLTPYSRSADGLAVLRSSLREYVCSEAMHHLGIPTTRALSLILTGEGVVRDMFYDGHPETEPGAVVCRLAPSFIRFGNFEIFAARNDVETLRRLVDYTIRTDFPELGPSAGVETYLKWLAEVSFRTAELMVHWMRVGFVHGVMNTDNLSILGLTIDYGPYGWLEPYDPSWTPNTTDAQGRRYGYGNQPYIAQWNLARLAGALHPLIGEIEPLQEALEVYRSTFQERWQETLSGKFGLFSRRPEDERLLTDGLELMGRVETDMTIFFRQLADIAETVSEPDQGLDLLKPAYYDVAGLPEDYRRQMADWLERYQVRLEREQIAPEERRRRMNRINPRYVFRNYLAQMAIDRVAEGDATMLEELLETLRRPYEDQPGREHLAARRPEWARHRPGCSMLSCSS